MVISAINRLSGQTVTDHLKGRFTRMMAPQAYRGTSTAPSAVTFLSHMRDLPFISLLLHLSLHLGNHLLHPSQLGNTEQKKTHVRETCDLHHRQILLGFQVRIQTSQASKSNMLQWSCR